MKHYCVHCKRFVDDTRALYIRTSDKGSRSWKPVRYICNSCLEIRPQPLPPRTDEIAPVLEEGPPVEEHGDDPKEHPHKGVKVEICDTTRRAHKPHYWLTEHGDFMIIKSERWCPGTGRYQEKAL